VEEAIAECDELTRDVFLKKYRYRRSRLYPLEFGGRTYDSKAIVGVAFGKQHGTPLRSGEFSGGLATVVRLLKNLKFFIQETPHPATALVPGRIYFRKSLLDLYGGQLQGGIWTPQEFPVVFLFSGDNGKIYGYEDGWTPEDVYEYTGEGMLSSLLNLRTLDCPQGIHHRFRTHAFDPSETFVTVCFRKSQQCC
jgi:5-methylcytosine-specific restriction protein A